MSRKTKDILACIAFMVCGLLPFLLLGLNVLVNWLSHIQSHRLETSDAEFWSHVGYGLRFYLSQPFNIVLYSFQFAVFIGGLMLLIIVSIKKSKQQFSFFVRRDLLICLGFMLYIISLALILRIFASAPFGRVFVEIFTHIIPAIWRTNIEFFSRFAEVQVVIYLLVFFVAFISFFLVIFRKPKHIKPTDTIKSTSFPTTPN